ncbi:hypothetical protein COV11_01980 [Candidatus Woesearchaeota archaeon CG10_big_fil_rev_8_21_14_0_10_30_7]|nr:MAG: hypothetical protein COV11_01980 [Candidatus Woesearchaeota archaeon CG10_big_fil_rev_8_21_14_0_10_30_7]
MTKNVCTTSELCQFEGISCMGCCGHSYTNRKEVTEGIDKNTNEFNAHLKTNESLIIFRDRFETLRSCGICRNMVWEEKKVLCPLHPAKNKGKDLRIGHCDRNYLCPTAKTFNKWSEKEKEKFRIFIRAKKLDWYSHSMGMDSGKLLKEFKSITDF